VFGATLSMLVAQGPVILYTLGLFIKPLNQDFGWDCASISAAGGLAAISSAIAIPFVGWLIDRWGIRPILLPIIVLDAKFDRRVHVFLCDHRFPGIGPRAARLREVHFRLVRRQARPGLGHNHEAAWHPAPRLK
jgi:hypothetical protein